MTTLDRSLYDLQGQSIRNQYLLHTVAACYRFVSTKVSTLPTRVLNRETKMEVARKPWMDQPNPNQLWPEFVQEGIHQMMHYGYWIIHVYKINRTVRRVKYKFQEIKYL